ncbi:hypothetical protein [Mycobacterium sp. IS-1496]|uniref:hypothetical protein n=1 Tax=Mycobacterium sp. IS-1496 TaxID=1772284 RepID=UPI0012FB4E8D|nr:hypothetical protein [Mycobacterium sp. IS-1496]
MTVLDNPTLFFGADAMQDPYPTYARMRQECFVHRIAVRDDILNAIDFMQCQAPLPAFAG